MKWLFKCFILLGAIGTARSQYVPIPDRHFGEWLKNNGYSRCMKGNNLVGWKLDTTCHEVKEANALCCHNTEIRDLSGVQYFINLRELVCTAQYYGEERITGHTQSKLAHLPTLPLSLKKLTCSFGMLDSLPSLPANLEFLDCSGNHLRLLPALPSGVERLECQDNMLSALPILPAMLYTLNCNNNELSSLPDLPLKLTGLYCGHNHIDSLPRLPPHLESLRCDNNKLVCLPPLPANLNELLCDNNQLTRLPTLPEKLEALYCNDNELSELPPLPASVNDLICSCNRLTKLPELPYGIRYLTCDHNQLHSLPSLFLPDLAQLDCSFNPDIRCLPNIPGSMSEIDVNGTGISCLSRKAVDTEHYFIVLPYPLPDCGADSDCTNNKH